MKKKKDLRARFLIIAILTALALIGMFFLVTELAHSSLRFQIGLLDQSESTIAALELVKTRTRIITGVFGFVASVLVLYLFYWSYKTSRKLAELARRNQVHERLVHTETLASGLVHELRNPLNAVKMNLQLLEEDLEREESDSPQRRRVERVLKELDRLDRVLSDFLTYARPRKLEKSPGDVSRVLDETLSLVEAQAQAKGVHVLRDLPDGLPAIPLDADALKQAFLNLILNALGAMEEKPDGTLIVRAGRWGGGARIEITDTGKGIAPHHMKKIFSLFFTTKQKGNGMGLAVVKRIIEEHDGSIEVSSEEGKGTSFTILLPGA